MTTLWAISYHYHPHFKDEKWKEGSLFTRIHIRSRTRSTICWLENLTCWHCCDKSLLTESNRNPLSQFQQQKNQSVSKAFSLQRSVEGGIAPSYLVARLACGYSTVISDSKFSLCYPLCGSVLHVSPVRTLATVHRDHLCDLGYLISKIFDLITFVIAFVPNNKIFSFWSIQHNRYFF